MAESHVERIRVAFESCFESLHAFLTGHFPGTDEPIAAFQFTCTYLTGEQYLIEPLLIAPTGYEVLLETFIKDEQYGSILFSARTDADHKPERWGPIVGRARSLSSHKVNPGQVTLSVPKGTRNDATFDRWNEFLGNQQFGVFSVWLSLTDRSEKKHDRNDLGNWTASIDFFGVLNVDLSNKLPSLELPSDVQAATQAEKYIFKTLFFDPFYRFINNFGFGIISRKLGEDLYRQAVRAAISQVMARNMSHNVGSHVLSKIKDERDLNGLWGMDLRTVVEQSKLIQPDPIMAFEKLGDDVEPAILEEQKSVDSASDAAPDEKRSERIGNEPEQYIGTSHEVLYDKLDFSKGDYSNELSRFKKFELLPSAQVAYFNEYLKNRMDYLADIATADPVMENAVFLYADVFKGFDRNRILLNRISGISSERFKYSISLYLKHSETGTLEELNSGNDIPISMTNDILGAQAFYIILENIIRNIAKHSKVDGKQVRISVVIEDYEDNAYYEISTFDNLWRTENEIAGIVCKRNTAINSSILLKTESRLRQNDLGTIEMDVCAAYLQRLPITEVESNDYRLKFNHDPDLTEGERGDERSIGKKDHEVWNDRLLEKFKRAKEPSTKYPKIMFAYAHENPNAEDNEVNRVSLGYKFYLKKPQEVLVVTDDLMSIPRIPKSDNESYSIEELKTFGITVITLDQLLGEPKVFNHQLMYFQTPVADENKNKLDNVGQWLPKRHVEVIDNGSFMDCGDFISQVWGKYAAEEFLKFQSIYIEGANLISGKNGQITVKKPEINLDGEIAPDPDNRTDKPYRVFIDDHHYNWSGMCFGSETDCGLQHYERKKDGTEKQTRIYPHKWNHYEMTCGHSRLRMYAGAVKNASPSDKFGTIRRCGEFISQYVETVLTKVVVIDERIQENIANPKSRKLYAGKVDFYRYFKQQGIVIPRLEDDKEPNLNESSFGTLSTIDCYTTDVREMSISDKIRCFIHYHVGDSRFVVIHLGILEKMLGSGKKKDTDAIEELLKNLLSNSDEEVDKTIKDKIIITSGRGQPTSIPEGYSYVPLAPIQNAIETVFDKIVLTRVLYNSRGIRK